MVLSNPKANGQNNIAGAMQIGAKVGGAYFNGYIDDLRVYYDKYLTEIVTPKIPNGGRVIIKGYTDIIGEESYNKNLSLARANDVKSIIEKSLAKSGRSDVKFEVYGSGEDESKAPFDNKYPEERFYNRTVVIDILPAQ